MTGGRSLVLVLPGGGYHGHADHEAEPIADWLVGLGHGARVIRYPVAPARYPEARDLVHREVLAARADFDGPIGVLGFSAGGHLAGHAALTSSRAGARPDFAVLCYPVVSFVHARAHLGSRDNLLGDRLDLAEELSLENLVTAEAPPMFLWHTADDPVVPAQNSYLLATALAEAGVPHEVHVYPHGRHGLGLAAGEGAAAGWSALCADWLDATTPTLAAPTQNRSSEPKASA
ncbi:alpha/beta hydrolase [Planctomonas deserti]|uniref:alpha/beta hydrolase n=1 Tax=Planctomonas deserti TaxID=2144185 RepID=UPI000D39835F|nr:alpha/beta hydrolase [Planctomonas deserti]